MNVTVCINMHAVILKKVVFLSQKTGMKIGTSAGVRYLYYIGLFKTSHGRRPGVVSVSNIRANFTKQWVTVHSRLQHQYYGIVCLYQLDKQVLSTILRDYLRLIYLLRRVINLSYMYFACFYHYFYNCCLLFLLIIHSFYNSIEDDIIVMKKHRIWF